MCVCVCICVYVFPIGPWHIGFSQGFPHPQKVIPRSPVVPWQVQEDEDGEDVEPGKAVERMLKSPGTSCWVN